MAINVQRVNTALKNWSPKGLCGGVLVQKNGNPKKTEACAVGALAIEAIFKDKNLNKKVHKYYDQTVKDVLECDNEKVSAEILAIDDVLKGQSNIDEDDSGITGAIAKGVRSYYGLKPADVREIMKFNDSCLANKGTGLSKEGKEDFTSIPESIRKTVHSLRAKFRKAHTHKKKN